MAQRCKVQVTTLRLVSRVRSLFPFVVFYASLSFCLSVNFLSPHLPELLTNPGYQKRDDKEWRHHQVLLWDISKTVLPDVHLQQQYATSSRRLPLCFFNVLSGSRSIVSSLYPLFHGLILAPGLSHNWVDPASLTPNPPWLNIFIPPEDIGTDPNNFGGGIYANIVSDSVFENNSLSYQENGRTFSLSPPLRCMARNNKRISLSELERTLSQ